MQGKYCSIVAFAAMLKLFIKLGAGDYRCIIYSGIIYNGRKNKS